MWFSRAVSRCRWHEGGVLQRKLVRAPLARWYLWCDRPAACLRGVGPLGDTVCGTTAGRPDVVAVDCGQVATGGRLSSSVLRRRASEHTYGHVDWGDVSETWCWCVCHVIFSRQIAAYATRYVPLCRGVPHVDGVWKPRSTPTRLRVENGTPCAECYLFVNAVRSIVDPRARWLGRSLCREVS